MNKFEKKYGIKEDEAVKDFHRKRRMFCIYNNILHIADSNVDYSQEEIKDNSEIIYPVVLP